MLADDMACNARNQLSPAVFHHPNHLLNLYEDKVEVDYRGQDVTVHHFLDVLTGDHALLLFPKRTIPTSLHGNSLSSAI